MIKKTALAAALLAVATTSFAAPNVATTADVLHPDIHTKVGQGDGNNANANPNGKSGNGSNGGQIHGIANTPGQSGADPSDGAPGFADQLQNVHGGIGTKNKNAN